MNAFQFDPNRHVPVTDGSIPKEDANEGDYRRPDIAPASAWARTAVVVHRKTKQRAVVHRVDLVTRQMRLWYPDRIDMKNEEQFDGRTAWQSLDGDWEPEITFSPEEIERQTAQKEFDAEIASLDESSREFVVQFCDGPDARARLAKFRALRKSPVGAVMQLGAPPPAEETTIQIPAETAPAKKGK